MDIDIRMGSGGRRRHEDDDRSSSNTTEITGAKRWVFLGVVLAIFAGVFFFMGTSDETEASPEEACALWSRIDTRVTNTGDARSSVESDLRRLRAYAKGTPELEELASDLARGYRNGTVDVFDKQDLTEACTAYT
jgi:hypothetical protein